MKQYRADLHLHTLLSPCGSLEMSPAAIIAGAVAKQLDMIAITDHNHTGHCRLVRQLAGEWNIYVLYGAEVTTREEVHCLTLFDTDAQIAEFQAYLDAYLPPLSNHPEYFGDQVIIGEKEEILCELPYLLTNGIDRSIEEVEARVHELGGLFIPAHVDRPVNGLYSQLGIFPGGLQTDAVEISRYSGREMICDLHPELAGCTLIQDSDAHHPSDIGRAYTLFEFERPAFEEVKGALRGLGGRRAYLP